MNLTQSGTKCFVKEGEGREDFLEGGVSEEPCGKDALSIFSFPPDNNNHAHFTDREAEAQPG
jgi:hypothetical protein